MQAGLGEAQEEYLRLHNLRRHGELWVQIGKRFHTTAAGAQARYNEDEKEWNRGMKLDTLKTAPIHHKVLPEMDKNESDFHMIMPGHHKPDSDRFEKNPEDYE
jgi:hypothetical protein